MMSRCRYTTDAVLLEQNCLNDKSINGPSNAWYPLTSECYPRKFHWNILWGAIFNTKQLTNIIITAIITLLAILLNSAAIEEETETDVDFDRELFTCGVGNFLCGAAGPPSHSPILRCVWN